MPRRKRKSGIQDLIESPWQVSVALAAFSFAAMRWLIPSTMNHSAILKGLSLVSFGLAPFAALFFLLLAALAFFRSRRANPSTFRISEAFSKPIGSTLVNRPPTPLEETWANITTSSRNNAKPPTEWSINLLKQLEWKRFEELSAAYFQALGLRSETLRCGPDGGIDAKLFRGDSSAPESILQCKAWNSRNVRVKPVRELYGVMAHHKVAKGIFLTTSGYTQEARIFAQEKSLFLIDGAQFLEMISKLSPDSQQRLLLLAVAGDYKTPTCPSCGVKMVERKGAKGAFWGCINFPRCKQTFVLRD